MPNHTDCRMFLIGPKDNLDRLLISFAAWDHFDESKKALMEAGPRPDPRGFWSKALKKDSFFGNGLRQPSENVLGKEREMGFPLGFGKPMPQSLMIESGSTTSTGLDILEGDWSRLLGYPHWKEKIGSPAPKTREEMIAWAEKNEPEMIRLGRIAQENQRLYGCKDWYDWSIRHWGTKWDTYDVRWKSANAKSGMIKVEFNTAWSPPLPALTALCEKMAVSAAIGYVDEGGGFSDYALIDSEGIIDEDVGGGLRGRALWSEVKAAAKEIAEGLSPEEKKGSLPPWINALLSGKEPTPAKLKRVGEPCGVEPADAIMASLGKGFGQTEEGVLAWMDSLEKAGALSAESKTGQGKRLWEAIADQGWMRGIRWCAERLSQDAQEKMHERGLANALLENMPSLALYCHESLPEDLRPKGEELKLGASGLHTMAKLLESAELDKDSADAMLQSAFEQKSWVTERNPGTYDLLFKEFQTLADKRKIERSSTPAVPTRSKRGGV